VADDIAKINLPSTEAVWAEMADLEGACSRGTISDVLSATTRILTRNFAQLPPGVVRLDSHKAASCPECGGVNFSLLKSSQIECNKCGLMTGAAWAGRISD
jgi:hypothetical protein